MPLTTGSRLGSYEILSLLGVGGMGEVYRACDAKLAPEVAIHRELKPANVKITPEENVKVLDFGLAKMADPVAQGFSPAATNSPMSSMMATRAGMILGTAAYMSPEQASGDLSFPLSDSPRGWAHAPAMRRALE